MEEINILELFKYLKKKIFIIIITSLLFLLMGVMYTYNYQIPEYKSDTTLLLLKEPDKTDPNYTQNDLLMNKNLITTYSEIIKSKKVLNKVIDELYLSMPLSDLTEMITVASQKDSILISITVTSKNQYEARDIANSIASIFSKEIKQLLNMQNVGIVDEAEVAKEAYNVSPAKQLVLATVLGLILSISIIFVVYYFDTTVKTEEQIEREIELPVIGIIPERKRSSKWKKR